MNVKFTLVFRAAGNYTYTFSCYQKCFGSVVFNKAEGGYLSCLNVRMRDGTRHYAGGDFHPDLGMGFAYVRKTLENMIKGA